MTSAAAGIVGIPLAHAAASAPPNSVLESKHFR